MLEVETKWPDPKDGAGSDVSEEGTASTVQTHQSSSIVTLPPSKVRACGWVGWSVCRGRPVDG